jgi:hypothetical protein
MSNVVDLIAKWHCKVAVAELPKVPEGMNHLAPRQQGAFPFVVHSRTAPRQLLLLTFFKETSKKTRPRLKYATRQPKKEKPFPAQPAPSPLSVVTHLGAPQKKQAHASVQTARDTVASSDRARFGFPES